MRFSLPRWKYLQLPARQLVLDYFVYYYTIRALCIVYYWRGKKEIKKKKDNTTTQHRILY